MELMNIKIPKVKITRAPNQSYVRIPKALIEAEIIDPNSYYSVEFIPRRDLKKIVPEWRLELAT